MSEMKYRRLRKYGPGYAEQTKALSQESIGEKGALNILPKFTGNRDFAEKSMSIYKHRCFRSSSSFTWPVVSPHSPQHGEPAWPWRGWLGDG